MIKGRDVLAGLAVIVLLYLWGVFDQKVGQVASLWLLLVCLVVASVFKVATKYWKIRARHGPR